MKKTFLIICLVLAFLLSGCTANEQIDAMPTVNPTSEIKNSPEALTTAEFSQNY